MPPPWVLPALLIGAGLASTGALWLRRRRRQLLEAPLREMGLTARRLADGDRAARFTPQGLPEIRLLAQSLNAMADTLDAKMEELKRLERVRIDFVANVSHELRTPLTSIKGFTETLREGALEDPENARRFLGIIQKHTDRIITVVDDLLTLSRMEGAEAPLNLAELDLASLVEEVAQGLGPGISDRRLALSVDLERPAPFLGDKGRLAQVVTNLLDNAVKYTPEEGRISMTLRRTEGSYELTVSDTGGGIEPWHLGRIFERFYRADKARSREMGGTGLGLAIVKHLVQAHGGTVSVRSTVGKGSMFTVRLPDRSAD
jgi:two-component system phosphate regulon sensor histidine kinase PhoR